MKSIEILKEVSQERERQDSMWGQQNHSAPEYLMILGEEVGEANKEALEAFFEAKRLHRAPDYFAYRKELIQVAAVAVAMVECLDRNGK